MDYIKETDNIVLASGELIKNNERFSQEELADFIKNFQTQQKQSKYNHFKT